ncbi:MAG: sigma-54 dependent transcriptional regulator [Gammaproteobacteria bacterium]|nr:sigma-54 dependent transcriptional regulator [Gammaproteobacteria bacterium]
MSRASVWLIDSDKERRESLRTILEFLDWSPISLAHDSNWAQVLGYDGKPAFVILGCDDMDTAQGYVNALTAMLPAISIIHLDNSGMEQETLKGVMSQLQYPLHQGELNQILETISQRAEEESVPFAEMVGRSPAMQNIRQLMSQVADSEANVLVLGESGTGKEVVARCLHNHSSRADKPFVPVNCGAIPAELLESELFGHEKGAFTGAISSRKGRFELAEGGTLFLDEIGDMSLNMQVKLLRVLQERVFERVGGNKSISADVRIVAATHRNLEQLIQQGLFREDLYYRLNVFPIDMPPLRERSGDIPPLVNELLNRISQEQRGQISLSSQALDVLGQYAWPGNVRELSNVVERLVIMYPEQLIGVEQLPAKLLESVRRGEQIEPSLDEGMHSEADYSDHYRLPGNGIDLKKHLSDVECSLIKQALDESGGIVAHAAKRLHLRRTTLVEKLRKYGLNQRRPEAEATAA